MMLRVSSSSPGLSVGTYRWVPRGCPTIRQACRSLSPYFCRAASTACRRRSGLTIFPARDPKEPASPVTDRRQAFSTGCSHPQAASGAWPDPRSGRRIPCAIDSTTAPSFQLPCKPQRCSCLGLQYLNLPQLGDNLLGTQPSSFRHGHSPSRLNSLTSPGSEKAGQVTANGRKVPEANI